MKPQLIKVAKEPMFSFNVRRDLIPHMNNKWHYHPEVELIHIKKGSGTQLIGDSIEHFKAGDMVLVGANLPHYWRFDDKYFEEGGPETADVRVAHFAENFWGPGFLDLPENLNIRNLLEKSRRGLQIKGKTVQKVAGIVEDLLHAEGAQRIILLMQALITISECKQLEELSSIGFKYDHLEIENDRINTIYEYTLKNYKRPIQLEEIAGVANISPNSFCRYFKSKTRKTYSKFVIEVRVGHACRLLMENRLSVKQLCYESGFNNFTSFHKYFKIITGKSPLTYQKEFMAA